MITAALALVAGASPSTAVRLGAAMLALQTSIGSLNDLMDAGVDAGRGRGKPMPAGLVGPITARTMVVLGLVIGLLLAVPSGPIAVAVALAGVSTGYLYNLRLKRTAVSWAPFAIGVPLLPVFAWVGSGINPPAAFAVILPLAALAGAGLAISNARADYERDLAAGTVSLATRLGLRRSWQLGAAIHLVVVVIGVLTAAAGGGGDGRVPWGAAGAGLVILGSVALGRDGKPARRQLAWEVQAAGIGLLAIVWLIGVAGAG